MDALAKMIMDTVWLTAAGLSKMISNVTPESHDVERKVDDILGLAFSAFNLAVISEAEFREVTVRCLDRLTYLAR
jgi:hypothetical protein